MRIPPHGTASQVLQIPDRCSLWPWKLAAATCQGAFPGPGFSLRGSHAWILPTAQGRPHLGPPGSRPPSRQGPAQPAHNGLLLFSRLGFGQTRPARPPARFTHPFEALDGQPKKLAERTRLGPVPGPWQPLPSRPAAPGAGRGPGPRAREQEMPGCSPAPSSGPPDGLWVQFPGLRSETLNPTPPPWAPQRTRSSLAGSSSLRKGRAGRGADPGPWPRTCVTLSLCCPQPWDSPARAVVSLCKGGRTEHPRYRCPGR